MIELLLQAERALSVGLLDRAETLYRQVARADPQNSIAVVGLARVTLDRGDDEGALELARRALEIDSENVAAQRMVARLEEVIDYRVNVDEALGLSATDVDAGDDDEADRTPEAAVEADAPAVEADEPAGESRAVGRGRRDRDRASRAEPEPATAAEPEPATAAEPEIESEPEPEPEPATQPAVPNEPTAEDQPEPMAEPAVEPEPVIEPEPGAEAEPVAGAGHAAEAEHHVEPEQDVQPQSGWEPGPESEPEPESEAVREPDRMAEPGSPEPTSPVLGAAPEPDAGPERVDEPAAAGPTSAVLGAGSDAVPPPAAAPGDPEVALDASGRQRSFLDRLLRRG